MHTHATHMRVELLAWLRSLCCVQPQRGDSSDLRTAQLHPVPARPWYMPARSTGVMPYVACVRACRTSGKPLVSRGMTHRWTSGRKVRATDSKLCVSPISPHALRYRVI